MASLCVRVELDPASQKAALQSAEALAAAVDRLPCPSAFFERFPDVFTCLPDGSAEVRDENIERLFGDVCADMARGADKMTVFLQPSDLLRELVAALAGEIDREVVEVHGWPVLSVGGSTPTVAEAGGVNNPASGGLVIGGQA